MTTLFDPEELHSIIRSHVSPEGGGKEPKQLIHDLIADLAQRHPGRIDQHPEWIINNAGGGMGQMAVLYASLTEYITIFGTPVGSSGHSGRFPANDWFFILHGEHWIWEAGDFEKTVLRPGDFHHLTPGSVGGYRMPGACWAMEYARGFVPGMLPFGVADTITSTLDAPSLAKTFSVYGKATMRELLRGKI